jgi:formylmethanofuran--tetrahydromethanopterin N-formyltransferase
MKIRGVLIEDTFAEAFTMRVARIVITGRSLRWVRAATLKLTGFATSVIGCKVEAGIERELPAGETPDGRPGASVLLMTMGKDDLGKRLIERIGQTVLTCPTTACYDGLPEVPERVGVGSALRFFGDGFQSSKIIGGQRFWRIPVMEGEFLVQETFGVQKGIGGGNFLILGADADAALAAAETIELPVQVDGKLRDRLVVTPDTSAAEIERMALDSPHVQRYLSGQPPARIVQIPGRLVNVVTRR